MLFKMSTEVKNILQNYITEEHDLDSKYFCPGAVTCPITFAFSFKNGVSFRTIFPLKLEK